MKVFNQNPEKRSKNTNYVELSQKNIIILKCYCELRGKKKEEGTSDNDDKEQEKHEKSYLIRFFKAMPM